MWAMSFDTDPANYDFAAPANQCPACYAANETPLTLFLSLSGITFGTAVAGVDPPPANGLWQLSATGPCTWFLADAPYTFTYLPVMPNSNLQATSPGVLLHFQSQIAGICHVNFENDQQNPAVDPYYGGFGTLINPLTPEGNSILKVLALLNISPTGDPWCNPIPKDDLETVYKVYDPQDATNIHILRDNP